MFGGLELCSLEAIVDAGGREFIIEVNDCAMGLLGDGQDEDRRLIADIVLNKMEVCSALAVTTFLLNIPRPPPPGAVSGSLSPGEADSSALRAGQQQAGVLAEQPEWGEEEREWGQRGAGGARKEVVEKSRLLSVTGIYRWSW